jgi:PAS domain S-box-containing protein
MSEDLERLRQRLAEIDDPLSLLEGFFVEAPVALQVYDRDGHSLIVNRAFVAMFGSVPPPEYTIFRDEIAERLGLATSVRRAFGGDTIRVGPIWYDARELEHVRVKVGRRVAIQAVAFPLRDAEHRVSNVAIVCVDVTAEMDARARLHRSETRFRALIENGVEGVALIDRAGIVRYQSPAIQRILGYAVAEDVGRPAIDQVHPEDAARLREVVAAIAPEVGATARAQYRVRHKDGSWRWVESVISNLLDEPSVQALVFNYRDVTEARAAEAEIRRLNDTLEERVAQRTAELQAAIEDLDWFTASVSHDLRAPLRVMTSYGELLAEHAASLPAEAQRYLAAAQENARRMQRLIDDLLAFSRLGRRPLARRRVDPAAVAREALESLAAESAGRDVDVQIAALPECRADRGLLRQVYANLIGNALKFTQPGKPAVVEVGARRDGGRVVYFVRDQGVGFDMRQADKLFGVFQRLHRRGEYEGTGVGLAIVRRIVERHGGRVWAESAIGRGATFYWTIGESPE